MNNESSDETNCGVVDMGRNESMESLYDGKEKNGTESPINGEISPVEGDVDEKNKEIKSCDEEDVLMADEEVEDVKLQEPPSEQDAVKVEIEKECDAEMEDAITHDKFMITDDNNNTTLSDHDQDLIDLRQIKLDKNLKLKQLQIELKNEEAKLILFKRLYYSQRITPTAPSGQPGQTKTSVKPNLSQQMNLKGQQPMKPVLNGNATIPPVIGGQPQRASILNKKNLQPHPSPQPGNRPPNQQPTNVLGNAPTQRPNAQSAPPNGQHPLQKPLPNQNQRPGASTPINPNRANGNQPGQPNNKPLNSSLQNTAIVSPHTNRLNNNSPINLPINNGNLINKNNPDLTSSSSPISAFSPNPPSSQAPNDIQMPSKKMNAATQAIVSQRVRKELEKSLAQIEFPKPPPQDLYFLPNSNNSEFLMCLGLEEVVKCVQEHLTNKHQKQEKAKAAEQLAAETKEGIKSESNPESVPQHSNVIEIKYEYPLQCSQCKIDFTPVWRKDKAGVVLCEKCLKNIEIKQIKTEHHAKLKQVFLKVVKDKETFEKQFLAEQQQILMQQQNHQPQPPQPQPRQSQPNSAQHPTQQQQRSNTATNNNNSNMSSLHNSNRSNPAQINKPNMNQSMANNHHPNNRTQQQPSPSPQQQQHRRSLNSQQLQHQHQQLQQKQGNLINHKPGNQNNSMVNNMTRSATHQNHQSSGAKKQDPPSNMANRQRQTSLAASAAINNHHSLSSSSHNQSNHLKSSSSTGLGSSSAAAAAASSNAAATAAQIQLAAAFSGSPALAAFAQQQQQHQQQAALLQRLMVAQQSNNFNPLLNLNSSAALNYLFPNQSKNWKNT